MILLMAVYTYANFPLLFLPGYGTQAQGMCQTEPGHVRHTFSAYLVMFLKTEDEGMQANASGIYGAQVVFFCVIFTCTACCTGMCPNCW